jgi:hypothetical protein
MNDFLLRGNLGGLRIGMPAADVLSLLGEAERQGKGMRGWCILSYVGGVLQIGHSKNVVGLIGIYFNSDKRGLLLPPVLNCSVPFSNLTTVDEFKSYLKSNDIPWSQDFRLRDATAFKVGAGVSASFDGDKLCSLLLAA